MVRSGLLAWLSSFSSAFRCSPLWRSATGSGTEPAGASRDSSAPHAATEPSASKLDAKYLPLPYPYPTTSHKHCPRSTRPPVRTGLIRVGNKLRSGTHRGGRIPSTFTWCDGIDTCAVTKPPMSARDIPSGGSAVYAVDVSAKLDTKSRTPSDAVGSAELNASASAVSFARRSICGPSSTSTRLSPSAAQVLSAGARTRCASSVLPATARQSANWSVA